MRRNRSCQRTAAILSAAISFSAASARGAVDSWIGGNGSWTIASNWTPGGQPASGDNVFLNQGAFTVTYDAGAIKVNIATLNVNNQQTLTQGASNSLSVVSMINVNGGSIVWNAGTLTIGQKLSLGTFSIGDGVSGTVTLSGGAINDFSYEDIGDAGSGILNQTGGINTLTDSSGGGALMKLGNGGVGTYNLSAGTINATTEYIGYGGAGTFNQTGGIHFAVDSIVGTHNAGTYLLSGGTLITSEATSLSGDITAGSGTFINSGGFHQTPVLTMGDNAVNATATYILSGTGVLQAGQEQIGNANGTCTFIQTGGTHAVAGETLLTEGSNFQMQAGTYTANTLTIRQKTPGIPEPTYTQTGGVVTVAHFNNGTLTQFTNESGGTFLLQGGSFTTTNSFIVGGSTIIQSGETFNTNDLQFVDGEILVDGSAGSGTLATLVVGSGGLVFGGSDGPTLELRSGSAPAKLVLNGNVSFTGLAGNAEIQAATVGNAPLPIVDLGGANRTFSIVDGADAVDFDITANITNGSITKTGTGQMDVGGNLDNTIGSITVNQGTLVLSGINSFIGALNMNGGTLAVFADSGLGDASNPLSFNDGALQTLGDLTDNRTITISADGGTFDVASGTTHTVTTSITGSSIFGKTGAGTLALTTNNAFSGALTISRGAVLLSGASASLPNISSVSVLPLSTFQLDATAGNPTNAAGFVNDSADVILGGGTFSYIPLAGDSSTETFHQLIPFSGGSNIAQGTAGATSSLVFTAGLGSRGADATVNYLVASPGTTNTLFLTGQPSGFIGGWATIDGTDFAAYSPTTGVATFTGESTSITPASGAFSRPSASFSTGTLTLSTLNLDTSTGNKTVAITSNQALSISEAGIIKSGNGTGTISNGLLRATGPTGELDFFSQGGPLELTASIVDYVNGSTTTPTQVVKSGRGVMILDGKIGDTYTGLTAVHAGTLDLRKLPGLAVPGDLLIDGGAVVLLDDEQISDTAFVNITAGTFNLNGHTETINSLTNSGGTLITGTGTLIVNSPHTTVLSAGTTIISGGSLNSTGMLVSGGLNTVQAGGVINVGTAGLAFSLNKSPSIILNADATAPAKLTLNGDVSFTGSDGTAYIKTSSVSSGQSPGVIDLGGAMVTRTFTVNDGAAATDMEISAQITDGALVKSGAGLLRLTATNTYAGGTTLNGGTLQIVNSSGLGGGSVVFNGGFLSLESDAPQTNINFALNAAPTATTTVDLNRAFTNSTTGEFVLNQQAMLGARFDLSGVNGGSLVLNSMTLESSNVIINNSIALQTNLLLQSGSNDGFDKTGGGTFTIKGNPSYTGAATVDSGFVELDGFNTIPTSLAINGPGTVQLLANDQIANTAPITLNGATGPALLDLNNFSDTINSVSFVAGGVVTTGTGTMSFVGGVSFTGAAGSGSISGNMSLGTATRTFNIADGSAVDDLVVAANISGTGGIIKAGAGELNLKGSDTFSGGVTVNAGTLVLGSSHTLASLAINSTSHLKLATGAQQASLILAEPTIASGAQLDMTNNDLILRSAPPADIRTFLKNGYAGGAWTGTGGITSSTAASLAGSAHKTALAYLINGSSVGNFDGFSVNPGDILIRYAAAGDANMDGVVNALDFNALATNYGTSSGGTGKFWTDGDFNYDGVVNSSDFDAIAGNFGYVFTASSGDISADLPTAALGVLTPEPSTALLLGFIAGSNWICRRRRRAALIV